MNSALFDHRVTFEREVRGRIHRFQYSMPCRLHSDIYEKIVERAQRRNVFPDIDSLIDSAVEKVEACSSYIESSQLLSSRNRIF